jgi:hypothetical protein
MGSEGESLRGDYSPRKASAQNHKKLSHPLMSEANVFAIASRGAELPGYFLGGGKSWVPESSSTTVIALTGQLLAASTIVPSPAPR